MIAVDMLTHAHRKNMNRATLLAGDQDFRPLIDALVRDGMFVELMYDPVSISTELADAADSRISLHPYWLAEWLPDDFKAQYPLPERSGSSEKNIPNTPPVETGLCDSGLVELYHDGLNYIIIRRDPNNPEIYLRLCHPNRSVLENVSTKTYGACEWASVA